MQCIGITGLDTAAVSSDDDDSVATTTAFGNHCVWERSVPTPWIFVIYAFVVPALAIFGLCANFINTIVFMRPKMTPSAFSYLAALSCMDCLSCLLITLTALSRSIFYASPLWTAYDYQWQLPLFGMTTGAANLILACVSVDRLVYLRCGRPKGTPRFCRRHIARRIICVVVVVSCVVNLPYFFVFVVNEDGTFETTEFYHSQYYKVHNWMTFILLAVLPALFLCVGNTAIIIAFRRWVKQSKVCKTDKSCQKRYQHQTKLTVTIVIVITFYIVGELPAHLTSRKSALNLLFGGDMSKVNFDTMERYEIICITMNALQLSVNIVIYAVINPSFMPEFFLCLRGASDACFRVLCCTGIVNCCRRGGNKGGELQDESDVLPPSPRRDQRRHRRDINSWGDDACSRRTNFGLCGDTGVGRGGGAAPVLRQKDHKAVDNGRLFCLSYRSSGDVSSWNENLKTDWVWKRSSSVGDFSFYNMAFTKESLEKDVDVSGREENVAKKRHSMDL